ncbi:MAG TPA: glycoside hydrolase family 25 protein [Candidatus Elarobacter sp.]|jgi:lysozyme|nr:glycoside hydrolase family 25 protein [Candidatus Elarobacter sp.]
MVNQTSPSAGIASPGLRLLAAVGVAAAIAALAYFFALGAPHDASSGYFALFGLLALLLLWLVSTVFAGDWNPFALAMGADNQLSTSKMQVLLWTACVGFVYATIYADRVLTLGQVDPITKVPDNVLIALGLSVTTAVAAKAITSSKVAADPAHKEVAPAPSYDPAALVRDDGASSASLTKVQMLFWTVVAIVVYLVTSFHDLGTIANCNTGCSFPDIDTTLMLFMGLGHATYVGGKLAGGASPALSAVGAADDGRTMTVKGSNLGSSGTILVDGRPSTAAVRSWTPTAVTFRLPDDVSVPQSPTEKMTVALSVAGKTSPPIAFGATGATATPQRSALSVPSAAARAAHVPAGMLPGIDVSYAETTRIDWDAVKRQDLARFVLARATYATYAAKNDENFVRNHDECKRLGIPFGAYHFFVFWEPGADQARHFLQRIDGYGGTLCPAVDVEEESGRQGTADEMIANLAAFIDTVERAIGSPMLIYTNQNTWNNVLGGTDAFAGHRLWVANPNDDPNRPPAMPRGFPDWTIYQYSWTGTIPLLGGGSHAVDLDVLKGEIGAITRGAPAAPAVPASAATAARAPVVKSVVYDGIDKKLKVFDDSGEAMFVCDARNDSVADNAWRADAGCPPGSYRLAAPSANDPNRPSTDGNDWIGEGRWFVPLTGIPGHDGIGIHGGGTCTTPPSSNALRARQGWCPTMNCIRVQNEDLARFVQLPLDGKPIDVVQSEAP